MNIFGIVILATILFSYFLELVTDYLNLKSLKPELPSEFSGVYDADKYKKSQEYTRVNTKFGFITSTFDLIVMLIFWFSGGFNFIDQLVRSWNLNSILSGISFIGIIIVLKGIIDFPFSVYSTFVIEEKFGFNKTTVKTFITDLIKGIFLGLILGIPLLGGILWFFDAAGTLAWIYCWAATTVFTLIIQFIAPTWIMPLFNKFTPLEEGELKTSIMNYAKSVDFSIKNVFVIDGSKRSSKSNAYFTGFGKNKRIALYDTLIAQQTVEELTAVIAHEIGHYKMKHIQKSMIISFVQTGVTFFVLSLFISNRNLFDVFYMTEISDYAGLIFFGMLYSPVEMILGIFMQMFSRKNEFEADHYAVETYSNKNSLIEALKKLSVHNLSNLTPHPLNVFLNYSHPPVMERINAIRRK